MCYVQVKKLLLEQRIEQRPRHKNMLAHGIERLLRIPAFQGREQWLVRDKRSGLDASRREIKTPEAEIVQQYAVGGILQEGVVYNVGKETMDALIVFQEAQHIGFFARILCCFDEAAQVGKIVVGGVMNGEVSVSTLDGFARLEDLAHLLQADGSNHEAAPGEYRYQPVNDEARHRFMHWRPPQPDFGSQ